MCWRIEDFTGDRIDDHVCGRTGVKAEGLRILRADIGSGGKEGQQCSLIDDLVGHTDLRLEIVDGDSKRVVQIRKRIVVGDCHADRVKVHRRTTRIIVEIRVADRDGAVAYAEGIVYRSITIAPIHRNRMAEVRARINEAACKYDGIVLVDFGVAEQQSTENGGYGRDEFHFREGNARPADGQCALLWVVCDVGCVGCGRPICDSKRVDSDERTVSIKPASRNWVTAAKVDDQLIVVVGSEKCNVGYFGKQRGVFDDSSQEKFEVRALRRSVIASATPSFPSS